MKKFLLVDMVWVWLAQAQYYHPQGSAHTMAYVAGVENSWGLGGWEKCRGIGEVWGFSPSPPFSLLVLGPAAQACRAGWLTPAECF